MRTNWDPKNVIVLMLDSFRADHLGAFGNSRVPTPNLDKFAAQSTFFTHSYPEGLPTIPVRTSLFTGKFTYPFRGWQVLYPQDHPLLAEILWAEGFRSALVSDTYHMHKPSYGFGRGFDDVIWIRGQEGDPYVRDPRILAQVDIEPYFKSRTGRSNEEDQTRTYLANRHNWKSEDDHFTPRVMDEALRWLKRQPRQENLFLWIDSFCPHEPWDPPERYLKQVAPHYEGKKIVLPTPGDVEGYLTPGELRNVALLYAGVIAFVDDCVGHFLEEIQRLGLFENSLIIIATDHGEPFGEHGIVRKARPWGYEELARTFLMIREPAGRGVPRVDSYTQQTDVTATILDYLSIPPPAYMSSRSLLPLILGKEEKVRDFAVCCHHGKSVNIRQEDWSYHYFIGKDAPEGSQLVKDRPEIYNLREDPTEHRNLIEQEPDRAAELDRRLRQFTRELVDQSGLPPS
jgi:arylsulfatase A-like enzyme